MTQHIGPFQVARLNRNTVLVFTGCRIVFEAPTFAEAIAYANRQLGAAQ
jgi:hypothetical protein